MKNIWKKLLCRTAKKTVCVFIVVSSLLFISCKVPSVVSQNGGKYSIIQWEGGTFVYLTYLWKGGKFDDAVKLERDFVTWAHKGGIEGMPIGRFPAAKQWQLGLITQKVPAQSDFNGYLISSLNIPAGTYAHLIGKGYAENMFFYWKKFKKLLIRDRYSVDGPVIEVYTDIITDSLPKPEQRGEIRYKVESPDNKNEK